MSTPNPAPGGDDPDTEGKTVPPYDGRREGADVDGPEQTTKDGARTAGATGPLEGDDEMKADEPADTERGAVASPADEQPAEESTTTDTDPDMTGPAHTPGTGRAEDKP